MVTWARRWLRTWLGAQRMSCRFKQRGVRRLAIWSALGFVTAGLAMRGFASGAVAQHSGTALYAALVYSGVLLVWPRVRPWVIGALAAGFCWLVELTQLTGVPARLAQESVLFRLVLGAQFDPVDLVWYPVGVVPICIVHWLLPTRPPSSDMRQVACRRFLHGAIRQRSRIPDRH